MTALQTDVLIVGQRCEGGAGPNSLPVTRQSGVPSIAR